MRWRIIWLMTIKIDHEANEAKYWRHRMLTWKAKMHDHQLYLTSLRESDKMNWNKCEHIFWMIYMCEEVQLAEGSIHKTRKWVKNWIEVNVEQMKNMHMTRNTGRDRIRQNITINFEQVQYFWYLTLFLIDTIKLKQK